MSDVAADIAYGIRDAGLWFHRLSIDDREKNVACIFRICSKKFTAFVINVNRRFQSLYFCFSSKINSTVFSALLNATKATIGIVRKFHMRRESRMRKLRNGRTL